MTRAVGFMKFRVDLILFIKVNRLIFLLSIYFIISLFMLNAVSTLLENQIEIIIIKETKANIIDEILWPKFYQILSIRIIIRKKTFLLYHIHGNLKELWKEYWTKPSFTDTVSLKRELLKKFEKGLDFFLSVEFIIVHSPTIHACQ